MAAIKQEYVPGVCNIGRAEVRLRRRVGWTALAISLVLWIVLVVLKIEPRWRLSLFLPATVATLAFLQAAWGFCVNFGLRGAFNFGPSAGKTDTVEQAEFRKKDRRTALLIIGLSALIAVAVAAVGYLAPI